MNAIAPSLTLTERLRVRRSPEQLAGEAARTPLGRVAVAEDQARVICFLASRDADFVTGVTIIPPGVETDASIPDEVAIRSGPGGRAGFADIAMRSGVGAFLGSFSGSISDEGARSFAISVYRELLKGASAAAAVQRARQARAAKEDVTRLLFALHGEGGLRLPVAGRG